MRTGLLCSFRNPDFAGTTMQEVYAEQLRQIRRAEELGYDTVWLTEHHFAHDGYSPSVLPIAAAIAATTSTIRIGTFIAITAFNDAVRWAEDVATIDVLSGGRFDLGLGQGYSPAEFAAFGISRSERLSRFTEFVDVVEGLCTQDTFSYAGAHYALTEARLAPRPVQSPHPPIWVGARLPRAIRRAAARGFHFMGGIASAERQQIYDDALVECGRRPEDHRAAQLYWVHVAETEDLAWEAAARPYHYLLGTYGQMLTAAGDIDADAAVMAVPPLEEIQKRSVAKIRNGEPMYYEPVFGTPDTVAARLRQGIGSVRTTDLALSMHLPGMDPAAAERSMELFAREVRPQLC